MRYFDQIIVGGGVIGAAIAYQLSKRGYKVLLLEESQIGAEASSAAAGMLGVQVEFTKKSSLFQFAKESRALFPELSKELAEMSGVDIQFKEKGAYKLVYNEKEYEELQAIAAFQTSEGIDASIVSPEQVMQAEQNIPASSLAALHCPTEAQVSAPDLTIAYATAAERCGAMLQAGSKVEELIIENNRIIGVKTAKENYYADQVVVTAGYKSKSFADFIPSVRNITPVKGECISVVSNNPMIESTIFTKGCYIVPKKSSRMIIGAVSNANQMDKQINAESMQTLLNRAIKIIPKIKEASIDNMWAGIRPFIKDDKPYLGAIPEVEGLYLATGHYRNGILLAPKTAVFMANIIEGKKVSTHFQEAFSPVRDQAIYI